MPFNACARCRIRYLSAVHMKWGLPSGAMQALSNVNKEGPQALDAWVEMPFRAASPLPVFTVPHEDATNAA